MKKIIILIFFWVGTVSAADFTIQFNPAPNSISSSQILSILSSKISDLTDAVLSIINGQKWKVVASFGGGAYIIPNRLMNGAYSEVYSDNGTPESSNLSIINASGLDNLIPASITCQGTTPSSGSDCGNNYESVGIVFNVPRSGDVKVCANFTQYSHNVSSGMDHNFKLVETALNDGSQVLQDGRFISYTGNPGPTGDADYDLVNICGYFHFSNAGNKAIRLFHSQQAAGMNFITIIGIHITAEPI